MPSIYTAGLGYYNYGPHGGLDVLVYVVEESTSPPALPPPVSTIVTIDVTYPDGSHHTAVGINQAGDTSGLARCDAAPHPVKKGDYHVEVISAVAEGYDWNQGASQTVLDFTI